MPTIASTLLLCLLELAASPWPRRRVDIVFEGARMRPRREAAAMQEVTGIWAAYGVEVRRANPNDEEWDGARRLTVVLADHPDLADHQKRHVTGSVLASISFLDDLPQPTIVVYPITIAAIVSDSTLLGLHASEWPPDLRELVLGRVLGRALAHEIGHFLLRSRSHAAIGLMRANPPVADLVARGRQSFFLSADDEKRLAGATTTASLQAAAQ
jgi:hypothetical protein